MRIVIFIPILIAIVLCFSSNGFGGNDKLENLVSVLDFTGNVSKEQDFFIALANELIDEIVHFSSFSVVDRANRDNILREWDLQLSDCVSDKCRVQVGRLLGDGKVISGTINKIGELYVVNIQLVNVESGEIENSAS